MDMKLTLAEPKYFKDSITIISDLVNEARLKVSKNAIELVAMDPANVAMVDFKLLSSAFVEYDVQKEMEIGVNLVDMKQVMRRAKQNDTVSIEVTADNRIQITFKGQNTRTFSLPIIELEEKEQKVPDLHFPVSISTTSANLSDAIEDVDIVAESVTFMVEPKSFTIQAEGDLSRAKIEIPKDDSTAITAETKEKVRSKYSIEYLKKMISGAKVAETVQIRFNKDYPLRLDFKEVDKVQLSFVLAPRVDND
jgi:proliferating cell nuclear antigen